LDVLGVDWERIFGPRDADQFVASVEQRQSNVEGTLEAINIATFDLTRLTTPRSYNVH
jgi:hypothetical protein